MKNQNRDSSANECRHEKVKRDNGGDGRSGSSSDDDVIQRIWDPLTHWT